MNKESRIERIFEKRFDPSYVASLKKTCLRSTHAPIVRSRELTEDLLQDLVARKISAIHVPGYCEPARARSAARAILKQSKLEVLRTDYAFSQDKTRETDMFYAMGLPRMVALRSESTKKKYFSQSLDSMRRLRGVFAPGLSPLDRLRLELDEIWHGGATIDRYEGKKGLAGVVFIKRPERQLEGIIRKKGVIHRDSSVHNQTLSANVYLNVPGEGGELMIWPVALNEKTGADPLYILTGSTIGVDPEIQEVLHHLLPKPLVVRPESGDLIILDTARPHAVCGSPRGKRVSIQVFIGVGEDGHLSMKS